MARFTYDDVVKISANAPEKFKRGAIAWVVAVLEDRKKFPAPDLPPGTIYTIEYESGAAAEVHESYLEHIIDG